MASQTTDNNENTDKTMKSQHTIMSLAAVALLAGFVVQSFAADEKEEAITMPQVPKAVRKALQEYARNATVRKIERSDVDGKRVYEFDLEEGARKFELAITPKGKFFGTEEEVQLSDVPEAVRTAINTQAGGGKVASVEKAADAGKKSTYEAVIEKDGKKVEVVFDPAGKVVSTEGAGKD